MIILSLSLLPIFVTITKCETVEAEPMKFLVHLLVVGDGILQSEDTICTGVIVNAFFIVSSAHCVEGNYIEGPETVIFYSEDRIDYASKNTSRVRWIKHTDFDLNPKEYDVALVELLDEPLYDPDVLQIGAWLSAGDKDFGLEDGFYKKCVTFGWGSIKAGVGKNRSTTAPTLKMSQVTPISHKKCKEVYPDYGDVVCTMYDGISTKPDCELDLGSPLVCNHLQYVVVFGPYITGHGCKDPRKRFIDVFRRLDVFKVWLNAWAMGVDFREKPRLTQERSSAQSRKGGCKEYLRLASYLLQIAVTFI